MIGYQKQYFSLCLALMLSACGTGRDPAFVYETINQPVPTLEYFAHCRGYGCRIIDDMSLSAKDFRSIKAFFKDVQTPQEERDAIRLAIAEFETMVGQKTGTYADIKGTYITLGNYQLDCVDESINTTTYLLLLEQEGVLAFHRVLHPTSRLPIISGRLGPHRAALIIDEEAAVKYAVDSWFHDNGVAAEIVPLDTWQFGWSP